MSPSHSYNSGTSDYTAFSYDIRENPFMPNDIIVFVSLGDFVVLYNLEVMA